MRCKTPSLTISGIKNPKAPFRESSSVCLNVLAWFQLTNYTQPAWIIVDCFNVRMQFPCLIVMVGSFFEKSISQLQGEFLRLIISFKHTWRPRVCLVSISRLQIIRVLELNWYWVLYISIDLGRTTGKTWGTSLIWNLNRALSMVRDSGEQF